MLRPNERKAWPSRLRVSMRRMRCKRSACIERPHRFGKRLREGGRYAWALPFALAGIAAPASAQAEEASDALPSALSVTAGASIWSGHFGAPTNTQIVSVVFGARYQIGGLRLVAYIPRMRIRSDGTFFAGLGGTPLFVAPKVGMTDRVRSGFGDLTVGASYLLPHGEARGFDVDLSVRAKVPTASNASQLSTGKADYSVGVDLTKTIGRFTPTVSTVYRIFGDNRQWQFRNGFDVTAGTGYTIGSRCSLVLNYEYVRAASRFIRDAHEVVLGASAPLADDRLRLTTYISKGLSNGAAAVSGGASLSLKL
ncbi:transporter [Sphingomonas sp.]|uniref:transporter n=1 Tax=Sphingomonas sp. TaxID=28214 RepID=UPI003B00C551